MKRKRYIKDSVRKKNYKHIRKCPICRFVKIRKVTNRNGYTIGCNCMTTSFMGRNNVVDEWNNKDVPFLQSCMRRRI